MLNATYSHAKVPNWTSMVRPRLGTLSLAPRMHGRVQVHAAFRHASCRLPPRSDKFARLRVQCIESTLKKLKDLNKPFKYVVTAVIMQKNGAGLHTATSCFWDNTTDGSATLRWENKGMYCLVTVFGLSI